MFHQKPCRHGFVLLIGACLLVLGLTLVRNWQHAVPCENSVTQDVTCALEAAASIPEPLSHGADTHKSASVSSASNTAGLLPILEHAKDLPPWALNLGREFWRKAPDSARHFALPKTFAVQHQAQFADAIERITYAFRRSSDEPSACLASPGYQARVNRQHLSLVSGSPFPLPGCPRPFEIAIRTLRITDDRAEYYNGYANAGACRIVLGNTVQTLLDPVSGLLEHYEARPRGVELTWFLPKAVEFSGSLVIESELQGSDTAIAKDAELHLCDTEGVPRWKIGPVTAVDAAGRCWDLALNGTASRLWVEVPSEIMAAATFPLAIDPLISPEFGLDQPVISPNPSTQATPSVASQGDIALAVWIHGKGQEGPPCIFAARLSSNGDLLDPYGLMIAAAANEQLSAAVAANEGGFLVAWAAPKNVATTDWDIFAARVNEQGEVRHILRPLCYANGVQCSPAVAGGPDNFFVAWRDSRNTGIYGVLLKADDSVSATNGIALTTASNEQHFPAVASLGTEFLVVWQDYRRASSGQFYADIYGARIDSHGAVLDPTGFLIGGKTNTQWFPKVAACQSKYLVVWEEFNREGNDINGMIVDADGSMPNTNGIAIATAINTQAVPVVASLQDRFVVAWQDYRHANSTNYQSDIYAAQVDSNGLVVDPEGIPVSTEIHNQSCPAIAALPSGCQLVWQDFRNAPTNTFSEIFGARLNELSLTNAPEAKLVSQSANYQTTPAIAASDTQFLVVWTDNRHRADSGLDIYGTRLDSTGQILDAAGLPLCRGPGSQLMPSAAAIGPDFLVAWTDLRNSPISTTNSDIYATRVTQDGQVLDPGGFIICSAPFEQNFSAISSMASNYLVVWQDARLSPTNNLRWDIYGTRVGQNGQVLDPAGIAICIATNHLTMPAVAANSNHWLVVWEDRRSSANPDIYGARVDRNGQVLDASSIPISIASGNQTLPVLASQGDEFLMAWTDARTPGLNGARLGRDGLFHEVNLGLSSTSQKTASSVASYDSDYYLVWQERRVGTSNYYNIAGVTLTGLGGSVANSIVSISSNMFGQTKPVIAGIGGRFIAVYETIQYGGKRISANRVQWDARLLDAQRLVDGSFQFSIRGPMGARYAIERSVDLTQWTRVGEMTNILGVSCFSDTNTASIERGFYRVILKP